MGEIWSKLFDPELSVRNLANKPLDDLLKIVCEREDVRKLCKKTIPLNERYVLAAKMKYYNERFFLGSHIHNERFMIIMCEFIEVLEKEYERRDNEAKNKSA